MCINGSFRHTLWTLRHELLIMWYLKKRSCFFVSTCDACGLKCINLQIGVNELSGKRLKLFKRCAAHGVHYVETDSDDYSGKVRLELLMEIAEHLHIQSVYKKKHTFSGYFEKARRNLLSWCQAYFQQKIKIENWDGRQHTQSFMRPIYFSVFLCLFLNSITTIVTFVASHYSTHTIPPF